MTVFYEVPVPDRKVTRFCIPVLVQTPPKEREIYTYDNVNSLQGPLSTKNLFTLCRGGHKGPRKAKPVRRMKATRYTRMTTSTFGRASLGYLFHHKLLVFLSKPSNALLRNYRTATVNRVLKKKRSTLPICFTNSIAPLGAPKTDQMKNDIYK